MRRMNAEYMGYAQPERRLKAPPWLKARRHTGKTAYIMPPLR
jgi:hypothetical protein